MTRAVFTALLACALPAATYAAPEPRWEVSAGGSGGFAGELYGFGVAGRALFTPSRYVGVGGLIDVMYLRTSGDRAPNSLPYAYATLSSYVAAVLELRAPLGAWMPYLEVSLGGVANSTIDDTNTSCGYGEGFGAGAGGGVKVLLGPHVALGVLASARFAGGSMGCNDVAGPHAFSFAPLVAGTASAHVRW